MRRLFILYLLPVLLSAQATGYIIHRNGADGNTFVHDSDMLASNYNAGSGFTAYVKTNITRVDPYSGAAALNGVDIPILTAVTGSGTEQNINIATTNGLASSALLHTHSVLVLSPGTVRQEVVDVHFVVDSTHVTVLATKNHLTTDVARVVFTSYSKFIVGYTGTTPSGGITNYRFIRYGALPDGVYDQYRVPADCANTGVGTSGYTTDDTLPWTTNLYGAYDPVPAYDTGSLSSTGNPSNGVVIAAGPIINSGSTINQVGCVQVQLLFTTTPEPAHSLDYRFYWDW